MSWMKVTRILDRDRAIDSLAQLRQEWQEAAGGRQLVEVQGNVGLLLADVVNAMHLLPEETARVLGCEVHTDSAEMRLLA